MLEFKMIKPRKTFHFNPPVQVKEDWMIGLVDREVYNSIFNITEENNKFEQYRDTSKKFGFLELKDELEEILNIPHVSREHLEDEVLGPRIIDDFYKLPNEKKNSDGYLILLLGYAKSPFRDFETYLRIFVGLSEEDIQLILNQNNLHFITFELAPGIHTFKEVSDAIRTFAGHNEILQIEYDDVSMKTKFILKYTREKLFTLGTLRFDKKSFFHSFLGFTPYWDYKHRMTIGADSPGLYTSDKILILNTVNKIHLKCDVIDGSVRNGLRNPVLFSFFSDKKPVYKVFCEPETILYKKINKSVLNTKTFYLEDDNNNEVDFNDDIYIAND